MTLSWEGRAVLLMHQKRSSKTDNEAPLIYIELTLSEIIVSQGVMWTDVPVRI